MVKKGHKYVTLFQINVPRVMILSQKLGTFFDKGTFIWQRGTFNRDEGPFLWQGETLVWQGRTFIWDGGSFIWQEGPFNLRRVTILLQITRGTKFWSCVWTLWAHTNGQKGTQICDPLANKCPKGHDSVSKTWDVFLTRGHLFDKEGHLIEMQGHLFDRERHLFDRKGPLYGEGS